LWGVKLNSQLRVIDFTENLQGSWGQGLILKLQDGGVFLVLSRKNIKTFLKACF
jgi:hypothetical protein